MLPAVKLLNQNSMPLYLSDVILKPDSISSIEPIGRFQTES